jgi:hypothetical protein
MEIYIVISKLFNLGKVSVAIVGLLSFSSHAAITKTFTINEDTRDTHTIFDVFYFFNSSSEIIEIIKHPTNGNLLAIGQMVSFTPKLNFCGTDAVSYKVRTFHGDSIISPVEPIQPGDPVISPFGSQERLTINSLQPPEDNFSYSDVILDVNYTVSCIDDPPTIDFIPPQRVVENSGMQVTVIIRDPDSSALGLQVPTNSNPSLLNVTYYPQQSSRWNGVEYVNRWSLTLNAEANKNGYAMIGLVARSGPMYSTVRNFTVTVGNVKHVVYVHTDLLGSPVAETN